MIMCVSAFEDTHMQLCPQLTYRGGVKTNTCVRAHTHIHTHTHTHARTHTHRHTGTTERHRTAATAGRRIIINLRGAAGKSCVCLSVYWCVCVRVHVCALV